jgi:hypothetical protein
MSAEDLHELEVMAAKLASFLRRPERSYIFKEFGQFGSQIISLHGAGLRRVRRELNVKAK